MQYWISVFLFLTFSVTTAVAQTDSTNKLSNNKLTAEDTLKKKSIMIANVILEGNKRTKPYIILREMTLKTGDIIAASELQEQILKSRNQVFNTSLFVDVTITASDKMGDIITIKVLVKERWYLFPVPYFTLVDRNFNQWWVTEKRDFNRINYGIQFTQYNLTGHNDAMNIWLINGFNKQVSVRYNLPFFNKSLKHGFNIGYTYSTQKQLNDSTSLNKQVFIKSNDFLINYSNADVSYSYRPDQRWRHYFTLSYTNESIADTVLVANPNYFPSNKTVIQFFDFTYRVRYLNLDYNRYPTKGYSFDGYIYKRGFDKTTNLWQFGLSGLYAHPLWNKTFIRLSASATVKTPSYNYFYNQQLFGYSNFSLRGLEYYVVDGDAGLLGQATLCRQIGKYTLNTHLKSKNYNQIPFRYYLKLYGDIGYAHNSYPGNSFLNNQLLYTGGIGLDVVSIYDLVIRIEFSYNQLGKGGVYLHGH